MRSSGLILLVVALAFSAARGESDRAVEQVIEKAYPIEPGATFSIKNLDGSIRIYGATTNVVKVQAIKKAYSPERLNKILVNISAQPTAVSIDTQYPAKPKWGLSDRSGTVDYVIVLPFSCSISQAELATGEVLIEGMRGPEVHAKLGNGRMFGHDCFGDLHFNVASGGLDLAYEWWENRKFSVNAEVVNGNVRAFLPGDASFRLDAKAPSGHVANDFTEKERRLAEWPDDVQMTVNGPAAAEIKIRAVNGNVRIAEANP